jgi:putative FmdB family regulatory protein
MPTYEYVCTSCGHEWEIEQRITADALTTCPKCSAETAKRQVSGVNFILKGGGWYADLYSSPKPSSGGSAGSGSTGGAGSGGGSAGGACSGGGDAAKSDSKSSAPAKTGSGSGGGSSGGSGGGSTPPST